MSRIIGLIVIVLIGTIAFAQGDAERLYDQFEKAYEAKDWERAVEVADRLAEMLPEHAGVAYNAACANALAGNADEAVRWLEVAGERGWSGIRSYEEDPDLDSVRGHAGFGAAIARVRANSAKRFEEFREKAGSSDLLTVVPRGHDSSVPAPLLIALHGSGGTPQGLRRVYEQVAREFGMVLVLPASHRPMGDGYSWTYRDESEWMVLHCIDRVSETHSIDADRIVLSGFSQGANVTLQAGLKHAERFAGLVPVCGHWEPEITTIEPAEGERTRVYLMIGALDTWAHTFERAEEDLVRAGYEAELRMYRGVGHAYPNNSDEELRRALRFVLGE